MSAWPAIAVLTPGFAREAADLAPRAIELYAAGLRMLVLREPELEPHEQRTLDTQLRERCPELRLVHHCKCPGTRALGAQRSIAVHLSTAMLAQGWGGPGSFGASVHDDAQLETAVRQGASYAMLAPVWSPHSKPLDRRVPLGPEHFERVCASSPLPLYALGGVTAQRCEPWRGRQDIRVALMARLFKDPTPVALAAFEALRSTLLGA